MICKLCHEVGEPSSSDKKMCKPCFSAVTKYRNLVVKVRESLPPGNIKFMERLEKMFKHNVETGGYVPRCYGVKPTRRHCATCSREFLVNGMEKICRPCKRRANAYQTLLSRDPHSPTLDWHHDYYLDKYRQGKHVPRSFLKQKGLL